MKFWQPTPAKLKTLGYLLAFLIFDLIIFGAFTRLTDSGLGCPDWPGCYNHVTPVGASLPIELAQTAMPTGPVTHLKAWIEMLHRYFATTIGFLIIVRLVWTLQLKKPSLLAALTLLWVCIQGAFGAYTVTMRLFPAIVTLHLLGGMVLLALVVLQQERSSEPIQVSRKFQFWFAMSLLALSLQIALGGWVSSNYAVLACSEFPTCLNGQWLPTTWQDWQSGFVLWRNLGGITFAAMTAIHLTHRFFAMAVLVSISGLIVQMRHLPLLQKHKRGLMFLVTLQIATGISNVVFGWPLLAATMHTAGAAALLWLLTDLSQKTSAKIKA